MLLRRLAFLLAGLFVALACWIAIDGDAPGDRRALTELTDSLGTTLDPLMTAIGQATDLIPLVVMCVAIAAFLVRSNRRADAKLFVAIVGTAFTVNPLMKFIIGRPRPDIRSVPETLSTASFPSGHASSTAAMIGALVLIARTRRSRRLTALAGGIVVVLVAFSRLAIGAHYPSDIIGGWLWIASLLAFVAAGGIGTSRTQESTSSALDDPKI